MFTLCTDKQKVMGSEKNSVLNIYGICRVQSWTAVTTLEKYIKWCLEEKSVITNTSFRLSEEH